jgi:hypothetical protein
MNDSDHIAAMYASQDDGIEQQRDREDEPHRLAKDGAENRGSTIALRIGNEIVLVPNPTYVARLEQRIDDLSRLVRRLEAAVTQTRHAVRTNATALSEVRTELDAKVDLRSRL